MKQKTYQVTLTGATDLLMHKDNVLFGDRLKKWQTDPANKKLSTKGDDRSPGWTWLGYLYHDDSTVCLESDNIMSCLRDSGKKVPDPKGKGNASMKSATQSGILCNELYWPLLVDGKGIPTSELLALKDENDFETHLKAAENHGFELFVKRAKVGASKHVRVRPRFRNWSTSGTLTVFDEAIDKRLLQTILDVAGAKVGLCDWRPGSPSPGQFGCFTAKIEEL